MFESIRQRSRAWLVTVLVLVALALAATPVLAANIVGFHTEWSPGYEKHYTSFSHSYYGNCYSPYGGKKTIYVHNHEGYGYFGRKVSNEFYQFASNC